MSFTSDSPGDLTTTEIRPILGDHWILNKWHLVVCVCFALFFVYLNYIRLFHTDIWCHVNYGNWMLDHGRLVTEDPFQPLTEGMRVVNNSWLSQIVFAQVERLGGPQYLSNLFAVVVLLTYVLYARCFYLLSGRKSLTLLGVALILGFGWTRHAIIRPEIFGALFLASLFWLLMRIDPWRSRLHASCVKSPATDRFPLLVWIGVPLVFALWANMHGSFAVGLVVMACHAIGRICETAWRERDFGKVIQDRGVRNWIWLSELAVAGTLLNPYGVDLLIFTARFGANENLRDVLEWLPLRLMDLEGIQFGLAVCLMLFCWRKSDAPIRVVDILLLAALAILMAPTVRFIGYFAPVLALTMIPHIRNILTGVERQVAEQRQASGGNETTENESRPPSSAFTLFSLLAIWCAFALSPISQDLLSNKLRQVEEIIHKSTPLGITKYLRENPPEGLVWTPQWWGDWVVKDGPKDIQVFMTTNLDLAPGHVWKDYMRIANIENGWEQALDRYAVNTIVVHKELSPQMVRAIKRTNKWRTVHEDELGIVFQRPGSAPKSHKEDVGAEQLAGRAEPKRITRSTLHGSARDVEQPPAKRPHQGDAIEVTPPQSSQSEATL